MKKHNIVRLESREEKAKLRLNDTSTDYLLLLLDI